MGGGAGTAGDGGTANGSGVGGTASEAASPADVDAPPDVAAEAQGTGGGGAWDGGCACPSQGNWIHLEAAGASFDLTFPYELPQHLDCFSSGPLYAFASWTQYSETIAACAGPNESPPCLALIAVDGAKPGAGSHYVGSDGQQRDIGAVTFFDSDRADAGGPGSMIQGTFEASAGGRAAWVPLSGSFSLCWAVISIAPV